MADPMSAFPPYGAGYGAPPADPAAYAAYGLPPAAGPDDVRTIYITGFPLDVKERDLNNLLRFLPGYEASQMTWKNEAAQGFALFSTPLQAHSALEALNTLMFDENSVLRAEMARKDMRVADGDAPRAKRARMGMAGGPYGGYGGGAGFGPGSGSRPSGPPRDNPPCNTLYVGNLGEHTHEADLRALFEHQPGFVQLTMARGARGLSAFVEFTDVAAASACHSSQQGASLGGSGRMVIQYARNPSGKKKEQPAAHPGYEPPTYVPPESAPVTSSAPATAS